MRALPLTNKSAPGGRSRASRAPSNAFSVWLATCNMTPSEVADKLSAILVKLGRKGGVSVSSVYNVRNAYFRPGLELASAIETLTRGKVKAESWIRAEVRAREPQKAKPTAAP